jgi:phosphotransferase system  glucose/maltose/N-acetylglucosamine-specific IIC component
MHGLTELVNSVLLSMSKLVPCGGKRMLRFLFAAATFLMMIVAGLFFYQFAQQGQWLFAALYGLLEVALVVFGFHQYKNPLH